MADDRELWRRLTAGVTPLRGRAQPRPPTKPTPPAASKPPPAKPAAAPKQTAKPADPPPAKSDGTAGLDRRRAQRLKRGKLPVEARLDLHGMTQAKAEAALERFLDSARRRGLRCVLVITGKGQPVNRAELERPWEHRREGVLRRAVPLWLRGPRLAPLVLSTSPARPEHGGAGALYVLLRRAREGGRQ